MLTGRFGRTTGRPHLEGYITLPRFQISGLISFVVDAGADKTVLTPLDAVRLGVNYDLLVNQDTIGGIGGPSTIHHENAVLSFIDDDRKELHSYGLTVAILTPGPQMGDIPSLLGRDILDQWSMHYDKPTLTFTVKSSDLTLPIPP